MDMPFCPLLSSLQCIGTSELHRKVYYCPLERFHPFNDSPMLFTEQCKPFDLRSQIRFDLPHMIQQIIHSKLLPESSEEKKG